MSVRFRVRDGNLVRKKKVKGFLLNTFPDIQVYAIQRVNAFDMADFFFDVSEVHRNADKTVDSRADTP